MGKATAVQDNEAEKTWNSQLRLVFHEIIAVDGNDIKAEISEIKSLVLREYLHSYLENLDGINKNDLKAWVEIALIHKNKKIDFAIHLPATFAAAKGSNDEDWSGRNDWVREVTSLREKIRRRAKIREQKLMVASIII